MKKFLIILTFILFIIFCYAGYLINRAINDDIKQEEEIEAKWK